MRVGLRSRVENVRAVSNGHGGIEAGENSRISGNVAARNGGANGGIFTSLSAVHNNVTQENEDRGIHCGSGCTVTGNTTTSNGVSGIDVGESATVIGNTATGNGSFGLFSVDSVGNVSGYANNVFNANNGGNANPQVAGGVQMGTNICGGDAICP